MFRRKRSTEKNEKEDKHVNDTVIFHHAVNELNEDTLQNTSESGTLQVAKMNMLPKESRRSSSIANSTTPLQIEYTPPIHSQHVADNKIDTPAIHDDQLDLLVHHKIYEMIGNQSQAARDKGLSKIVVNELKGGQTEIIGDKNSPVISNITFTAENDTLTAMAFIAGNLLNKLWNMEKDSKDSLETEHMKHKKIDDLLALFKEPLNLRQEIFLKNALEQLSIAIENDSIKNVSICKSIEEINKKLDPINTSEKPEPMLREEKNSNNDDASENLEISKATSATAALNKIGHALELIKKYEQTQNALKDLKYNSNLKPETTKSSFGDLNKDELTTLNVFGNIVESLTKMLIPYKVGKKIQKGMKSKNFLGNDQYVKNRFKNFNITDLTLTTKDKIVLDYITHIQNNPGCLLNKNNEIPLLPKIEGDILLNLAEFFKLKSMSDLLKLVELDSKKSENLLRSLTIETSTITSTSMADASMEKENNTSPFQYMKEKLKKDLKLILEDLVALQNISGKSTNGNQINIVKALPCIYNIINNKELNNNFQAREPEESRNIEKKPIAKVTQIIDNLKKELNASVKTRRIYKNNGNRPKSAIIWERTVQNLGNKLQLQTRRNYDNDVPKSFKEVTAKINNVENGGSNVYKSIAYLAEIPVAERLLLLKTLAVDTKKYISVFKDIKKTIETFTEIPLNQYQTITEFIENADININLNGKVLNKMHKLKKKTYSPKVNSIKTLNIFKPIKDKELGQVEENDFKLTRNQIINQLIKNRMRSYLKMKEEIGDNGGSINKNLAQKILFYLDTGKDNLAREMFRIFATHNNIKSLQPLSDQASELFNYEMKQQGLEKRSPEVLVPLIQFEDTKAVDKTS